MTDLIHRVAILSNWTLRGSEVGSWYEGPESAVMADTETLWPAGLRLLLIELLEARYTLRKFDDGYLCEPPGPWDSFDEGDTIEQAVMLAYCSYREQK